MLISKARAFLRPHTPCLMATYEAQTSVETFRFLTPSTFLKTGNWGEDKPHMKYLSLHKASFRAHHLHLRVSPRLIKKQSLS